MTAVNFMWSVFVLFCRCKLIKDTAVFHEQDNFHICAVIWPKFHTLHATVYAAISLQHEPRQQRHCIGTPFRGLVHGLYTGKHACIEAIVLHPSICPSVSLSAPCL